MGEAFRASIAGFFAFHFEASSAATIISHRHARKRERARERSRERESARAHTHTNVSLHHLSACEGGAGCTRKYPGNSAHMWDRLCLVQ